MERAFDELYSSARTRRESPVTNAAGWYAGRRAADQASLSVNRRAIAG